VNGRGGKVKNKIILFTQQQEFINNIYNAHIIDFEYEVVDDSAELFESDQNEYCMTLFDLDSFKEDFIEFFSYLIKAYPDVKLMTVSSKPDIFHGIEYLKDGVKGYGNSFMNPVHLQQAIDVICAGNIWIYPELATYMIQQTPVSSNRVDLLMDMDSRDKEIINFVCKGMRNKEIAKILSLSEISVKKLLSSIYQKLHIKDRVEMIAFFSRE